MDNDSAKTSTIVLLWFKITFIDEPYWYRIVVIGMAITFMIVLAVIIRDLSFYAVGYKLASSKIQAVWSWWFKRT
jgi:hypothetical protein